MSSGISQPCWNDPPANLSSVPHTPGLLLQRHRRIVDPSVQGDGYGIGTARGPQQQYFQPSYQNAPSSPVVTGAPGGYGGYSNPYSTPPQQQFQSASPPQSTINFGGYQAQQPAFQSPPPPLPQQQPFGIHPASAFTPTVPSSGENIQRYMPQPQQQQQFQQPQQQLQPPAQQFQSSQQTQQPTSQQEQASFTAPIQAMSLGEVPVSTNLQQQPFAGNQQGGSFYLSQPIAAATSADFIPPPPHLSSSLAATDVQSAGNPLAANNAFVGQPQQLQPEFVQQQWNQPAVNEAAAQQQQLSTTGQQDAQQMPQSSKMVPVRSFEGDSSSLLFSPPNTVYMDQQRPMTQPDPSTWVAPKKAAGDVSLSGPQLVKFLIKATLNLPQGPTREGVQLRIGQFSSLVENGQIPEQSLKKLNFVVDAIDRGAYEEALMFFEQMQSAFPSEMAASWVHGVRILILELRKLIAQTDNQILRGGSAGTRM